MRSPEVRGLLSGRRWLALVGIVAGCAAAPAGPRGPLRGRGIEAAMDFSNALAPATATLADGTVGRGGGDNVATALTFPPRRLEARLSPIDWADVGARIGWLEGDLDARVGLPVRDDSPLAGNLAAGFSSGAPGTFEDARGTRTKWLRLEAYPRLSNAGASWRLALALGVNWGRFFHEVPDPRPSTSFGDGPPSFDPGLRVLRQETRLETSLGLVLHDRANGMVVATVSPYFVLDAGRPQAACAPTSCSYDVVGYRENWGVVLVLRLALRRAF